jgi:tetratricopeptide (TPR) repeat protein
MAADVKQTASVTGPDHPELTTVPESSSSEELYSAAYQAYHAKLYEPAARLWTRAAELKPDSADTWNSLGLAYTESGKYEEAIVAFAKQIELEPFSKRAYADLGWAYEQANRADEAIAAYKKHIELNPLDERGPRSLGELYVDREEYGPAIPLLERAARIKKDGSTLIALGAAYVHTGRADEALKAFAEAAALDSDPATLKAIAWHLSEAGAAPDEAVSYASRSETLLADRFKGITAASVTSAHFDDLETLVWDWDVRGWAHFRKGQFKQALEYLSAAFQLSGNTRVLYHLAQAYERNGKLADALSAYLTVVALSESPTDEMRAHVKKYSGGGDLKLMYGAAKRTAGSERLFPVKPLATTGDGQFFVVVNGQGQVLDARFVAGDARVQAFTDALRGMTLPLRVPADFPAAVPAGVSVKCAKGHGCAGFVLYPSRVEAPR